MTNIWWSKQNHELGNFYLDVTFWLYLFLQLEHFLPAALCCFVSNAGKMPQIYEKLWGGLVLKTFTFKSVQLESITLLLNVNRHNRNFTKQNHLYVTSKPAQGLHSIRVQITFKVRLERKTRLLVMICCRVHYTIFLIMNFSHIVMYFRLHQQCYTAKKYDFSTRGQGWKRKKKSTHYYLILWK